MCSELGGADEGNTLMRMIVNETRRMKGVRCTYLLDVGLELGNGSLDESSLPVRNLAKGFDGDDTLGLGGRPISHWNGNEWRRLTPSSTGAEK